MDITQIALSLNTPSFCNTVRALTHCSEVSQCGLTKVRFNADELLLNHTRIFRIRLKRLSYIASLYYYSVLLAYSRLINGHLPRL